MQMYFVRTTRVGFFWCLMYAPEIAYPIHISWCLAKHFRLAAQLGWRRCRLRCRPCRVNSVPGTVDLRAIGLNTCIRRTTLVTREYHAQIQRPTRSIIILPLTRQLHHLTCHLPSDAHPRQSLRSCQTAGGAHTAICRGREGDDRLVGRRDGRGGFGGAGGWGSA
jgi:hypothetical protein